MPLRKGPKCTVAQLLERLDGEDLTDLQDALAGSVMSTVLAAEIAAVHQVQIPGFTIARHRRGECFCGRAR